MELTIGEDDLCAVCLADKSRAGGMTVTIRVGGSEGPITVPMAGVGDDEDRGVCRRCGIRPRMVRP